MNPKPGLPPQAAARSSARPGFENVVQGLVKGGPERQAVEAGEIDAIIDTASGSAILLPEAQRAMIERKARFRSLVALSSDWQTHRNQLEWRATFHNLELRYVDHAGEVRYLSVDGEPIFDQQDEFKGYRGTARDITGRKHAEQMLEPDYTVAIREPDANPEPANRVSVANNLLAALPFAEYQRLLAGLEPVTLTFGEAIHTPGAPIRYVYFPINCLVSLLTTADGRHALEVGLVGHEGMVGIPLALGIDVSPVRALVQGTGTAMRMETASFRKELAQSMPLQRVLNRYTHALMVQVAQTATCNNFHSVKARFARWLLMARDRVRTDEFHLTHELLAEMLGIRRVGVTNAAGALQKQKLISYKRGHVRILDRQGLEAAACQCYRIIKDL